MGLGAVLCAAPARAMPNGIVVRAGADAGYMWWVSEHEHSFTAPGRATRFEREPNGAAPAVGGRFVVGWKLILHRNISAVPRLGGGFARSRKDVSHLTTELNEYDFELEATWKSVDVGGEVELFGEWLTASPAIGYCRLHSRETVRSFAESRDGYTVEGFTVHMEVGVRAPTGQPIAGGLTLAYEALAPMFALLSDGHFALGTRLMLLATVEFDPVYFRPGAEP